MVNSCGDWPPNLKVKNTYPSLTILWKVNLQLNNSVSKQFMVSMKGYDNTLVKAIYYYYVFRYKRRDTWAMKPYDTIIYYYTIAQFNAWS